MNDTFMRQWQMLRMIPRFPSKVSASELAFNLADAGFDVTHRTLQRDLVRLSEIYPLVRDERNKPFGWSWSADAAFLDIPSMDSHTALTFWMANQHLQSLLPKTTLQKLQPHMDAAEAVLNRIEADQGVPAWRKKVRVLQQGQDLKPVQIDDAVQQQVYDGLLRNRKLMVSYKARREARSKEYELNPLGLVFKGGISYLVCSIKAYTDIRLLTLHRISQVSVLDKPLSTPEGFDLDVYIQSGEFGFRLKGSIAFKALFSKAAALHLSERPLSDDQTMAAQDDGRVLITANIKDTSELHWWLHSFGSQVEVLQPEHIRNEMIKTIQASMKRYGIAS